MTHWDVVVIGAGAAGLMAAARAAELGRRALLLEKNRKPGVKILMSGGTRCNLTQNTDSRGIVQAFGQQGKFLHSALAALNPKALVQIFEQEGVATKVEATGKIFPASDRALDVLNALLRRLERSGATLSLGEPLTELAPVSEGFRLTTPLRTLTAEKVIVTTGGQSYPGSGTTGDGYAWAAELGHTIVPPRPSLVPVTVDAAWIRELSGVTISDVGLRVIQPPPPATSEGTPPRSGRNGKGGVLAERRGSFLFTHFGLSGPVVLDVSREITGHPQPRSLTLEADFLPNLPEAALDDSLRQEAAASGKKQIGSVLAGSALAGLLPRRLTDALCQLAQVSPEHKLAEISKAQRAALVQAMKRAAIPVTGTRGFKKAEVTAGGVSLDEVDSRTMQSKRVPGLYIAGELLDLDGPIGGYNFQAAFSTGWLAGQNV
jgi:predicted Rossmann fold flavoprotein